jgi:hypothetical protein
LLVVVPGGLRSVHWVIIKVELDGRGAADVGITAIGIVLDGPGHVEREEGEGCTGWLLCTWTSFSHYRIRKTRI